MKHYLCGPMSGIHECNFPAFEAAASALRARGLDVVTPNEIAGEAGRRGDVAYRELMRRDLTHLLTCDAIVLLDGWYRSSGANLEYRVARALELKAFRWTADALKAIDLTECQGERAHFMPRTHTYSILNVSPRAFAELKARMTATDHASAIQDSDEHGLVIDMNGIALVRERAGSSVKAEDTTIELSTILSSRTNRGMVQLTVNDESTQLDVAKAREVQRMLSAAIEAAISDELLVSFLTSQAVGMTPRDATEALMRFREMRQGSTQMVNPH